MAVKRSVCVTKNPEKSPEDRWREETEYQMRRAVEITRKICSLARKSNRPRWSLDQVKTMIEALEAETQKVREAYEAPVEPAFRFDP